MQLIIIHIVTAFFEYYIQLKYYLRYKTFIKNNGGEDEFWIKALNGPDERIFTGLNGFQIKPDDVNLGLSLEVQRQAVNGCFAEYVLTWGYTLQ